MINIENLKTLKYYMFLKKKLGFPIVCSKCDHKYSIPLGIPSSLVGLRICVIITLNPLADITVPLVM